MWKNSAVIRADSLTKSFSPNARAVLRGVSLAVEPGESVALMGPSGSGKSTLLHLLGGLEAPSSGSVCIAEQDLTRLSDETLSRFRRRHLGFVFQFFNLVPTLTALENVELPLLLDGADAATRRKKALDCLKSVDLEDKAECYPPELSGGELQRVAVARALVADPWVVLADEPTGSLDSAQGKEVLSLLQGLCASRKTALFVVTHDPSVAARLDRTLTILDGLLT